MWGDLNGDGHLDLWVANCFNSPSEIWINDPTGSGTFTRATTTLPFAYSGAMADVNGDGHLDLFVCSDDPDESFNPGLYLNNAISFTAVAANAAGGISKTTCVAWADVNGDGALDLFVGNKGLTTQTSIPNELWMNEGSGTFHAVNSGPATSVKVTYACAFGDANGDG